MVRILTSLELSDIADQLRSRARSDNTKRTYGVGWRHFTTFLEQFDMEPTSLEEKEWTEYARLFTAHLFTLGVKRKWASTTIINYLASVKAGAKDISEGKIVLSEDFVLNQICKGTLRSMDSKIDKATIWSIDKVIKAIPKGDSPLEVRDRAAITTGLFGLLRGQELMDLKWEDLKWEKDWIVATIAKSKTDQLGKGAEIILPRRRDELCPIKALKELKKWSGRTGHIFKAWCNQTNSWSQRTMTRNALSTRLKRWASNAGMESTRVSSHTLRRSGASALANAEVDISTIMRIGRWKSFAAQGYLEHEKEKLAEVLTSIGEGSQWCNWGSKP